jgi:hypothetical protein
MCIQSRSLVFGVGVLVLWLCAARAFGASTIIAADCSPAAVRSAINRASTGDTVAVPAGTCDWGSTTVTIPSAKSIVLKGAGVDATTIKSSEGATTIRVGDDGVGGKSRVTGFTLAPGLVVVDGDGWRVDHMKISSPRTGVFADGVFASGMRPGTPYGPTGLVDHVTFIDTRVLVYGYPYMPVASASLWASPLGLGDGNAVYVEDSTFTYHGQPNAMDCNYGGRYVFRHNTMSNSSIDAHSMHGWNRACRRWEVYDNTIQLVDGRFFTPFFIRGGTGVIFNNTITGSWSEPFISFDNVRSFERYTEWFPISVTAPGTCDGSSPWDGNQQPNGWPCRDQIGRGGDDATWTGSSPYPPQSSVPAYLWNNTMNGQPATVQIRNGTAAWIQRGRDYIENAGPKPGYTPYPYPHPLAQSGRAAPLSPTNLTVR